MLGEKKRQMIRSNCSWTKKSKTEKSRERLTAEKKMDVYLALGIGY